MMTCPKCLTHHAEPTMSWTVSGRKLTVPALHVWACVNQNCRHQWPRELDPPLEVAQHPFAPFNGNVVGLAR